MTTPVYLTGFEFQAPVTANGQGLFQTTLSGTWVIDTTTKHSGAAALKGSPGAGAVCSVRCPVSVATTILVQRAYVRFNTLPAGTVVINILGAVNTPATSFASFCYNPVTGFFCIRSGASAKQEDNVTVAANTWYCIDFKANITGGNMVVDAKVNGRAITQSSVATTATGHTYASLGTDRTDHAVGWDCYYDDWVVSATSADYPIGEGGTQVLKPSAEGTHSIAANTLEDQTGADINGTTVTAYNLINSVPPSATTYIGQNLLSTTSYAEVLFDDISDTHLSIIGAMAFLAYTSATTTANNGATMVSKDSFATKTDVWGNNVTPADMSDGATNDLFFKSAIIAGAVDDATINALKARVGYSGDATPDPYWIDLVIEVAYKTAIPASIAESATAADVTSGTGNFNPAITEPVTSTDTPSATQTQPTSIAETITATDSTDAALGAQQAGITETTSATETESALLGLAASITESATSTDSPSGAVITVAGQTESVTSTDSSNAIVVFGAEISEPAVAVDSSSALTIQYAAIIETATSTDSPSGILVQAAASAEAVSATDSSSILLTTLASTAESASATEIVDGQIGGVPASITEAGAAADSQSASAVTLADLIETTSATETESATLTLSSAISEPATLADSQDAVLVQAVAITETSTALDTVNNLLVAFANISENSSAIDNQTTVLVTPTAITETTTPTDTQDGTVVPAGGVSITETVTPLDFQDAVGIYSLTLTETITATDSSDATGGTPVIPVPGGGYTGAGGYNNYEDYFWRAPVKVSDSEMRQKREEEEILIL